MDLCSEILILILLFKVKIEEKNKTAKTTNIQLTEIHIFNSYI